MKKRKRDDQKVALQQQQTPLVAWHDTALHEISLYSPAFATLAATRGFQSVASGSSSTKASRLPDPFWNADAGKPLPRQMAAAQSMQTWAEQCTGRAKTIHSSLGKKRALVLCGRRGAGKSFLWSQLAPYFTVDDQLSDGLAYSEKVSKTLLTAAANRWVSSSISEFCLPANTMPVPKEPVLSIREFCLPANTMPVPKEPVLSIRELGLLANAMPVPKEPVLSVQRNTKPTVCVLSHTDLQHAEVLRFVLECLKDARPCKRIAFVLELTEEEAHSYRCEGKRRAKGAARKMSCFQALNGHASVQWVSFPVQWSLLSEFVHHVHNLEMPNDILKHLCKSMFFKLLFLGLLRPVDGTNLGEETQGNLCLADTILSLRLSTQDWHAPINHEATKFRNRFALIEWIFQGCASARERQAKEQLDTYQMLQFVDRWFETRSDTVKTLEDHADYLENRLDWQHPQDVETHIDMCDAYDWSLSTNTSACLASTAASAAATSRASAALGWFYPRSHSSKVSSAKKQTKKEDDASAALERI